MKHVTAIILIMFVGVAIFGFFYMNHDMNSMGDQGCPVTALLNFNCSSNAMIAQHISAYENFSNVPLISLAIVTMFAALSALFLFWIKIELLLAPVSERINTNAIDTSSKRKVFYWLSLLENSPSI